MPFRPALLLLAFAAAAPAAELDPAVTRIKKDLEYLAGDECQGRGLKTQGLTKAGDYIAKAFKDAGLKSAFDDGSYFQPFTVFGTGKLVNPIALAFKTDAGKVEYDFGKTFAPTEASGPGKVVAGLVFVGYGISAPDKKYDDYAGVDVKGKVVVVLRRMPRADAKEDRFAAADTPLQSLNAKVETAAQKGAAGILFVNDRGTADKTDPLMTADRTRGLFFEGPVFHVKRDVVNDLLGDATLAKLEEGIDKEMKPNSFAVKGVTCATEVSVERPKYPTRNVIGVLPGAGPLANETVVIGAHYDHLGLGDEGGSMAAKGDQGKLPHYGADDNASGTSGLLELARRYGGMKDRQGRRLVFVSFSGEEQGLFGSKHYVKNPPFPLDATAFMINLDMIGRMVAVEDKDAGNRKRDRLVVYGTGTAEGLDKLVDDTNKTFDLKLLKVPGGSGPSDHTSFYEKKIPVLFLFTGTHKDYHKPTDTPDKINVDGLKKVADLVQAYATHYATVAQKPKYIATKGGGDDPTDTSPRVSRSNVPRLQFMPDNYGEDGGVLVGGVTAGGPAEKAGIKEGDLIVEIAGKPIKNMTGYMAVMGGQKVDVPVAIVVLRKDKKVTVTATPVK